ncbi:type VII secretion-associated serine protease mycosin [Streptomyces kunmingensis]|uniref:Type VII secretion-associated serine protease mycosin n=1 Tax=Streptomyces kunmingensis TaxID=68225 RepID=A0ABU6CLQ1_9ACTN|nr:type VII secretion-associated serine protease mycosin [Streptomyces kunmingensis]MEB3965668.1 type VII secretion-associated serine protease mycosin [Streptomyces kunmingensis]
MPTNSIRRRSLGAAASAALGLLLVGTAVSVPAYADSFRAQQWHLDAMKADQMWRTSTGKGITVAVLDTGVDANHPDLRGQVLAGEDLSKGLTGNEHADYDGHGTGIAGVIAGTGDGNGGNGAFGLAPGAKILPIRLSDGEKAANRAESSEWLFQEAAEGIKYAADHGAKVINVSQGGTAASEQLKDDVGQLSAAVDYALKKGSLVFAAVGNSGDTTNIVEYPAATPGVVGVAAIDKNGHRTSVSEYGPQVDISAPGEDIVHACGGKTGYCKSDGTSDATALASASAALIWSKHPDWTNNQVLRVILNTIGGVKDNNGKRSDYIGYGAVRPRIALTDPGNPGPADKFPMSDFPVAAESSPPAASKGAGAEAGDDASPAASPASESSDGDTLLWVGVGVGAVLVVTAAIAIPAARRRRKANIRNAYQAAPHATGQPYGPVDPSRHGVYGAPPRNEGGS